MPFQATQAYETVLYLSKFVIDDEVLDDLAKKLPKILTQLHVQKEDIRVSLIDRVQLVLNDLREVKLGNGLAESLSRSTRKFVRWFFVLFGVLVNLTLYKRFFGTLIRERRLGGLVDSKTLKLLAKVSAGVSGLVSLIPFVEKLLQRVVPSFQRPLPLATVLTSFSALSYLPDSGVKDYFAIYSIAYGLESYLSYINDRFKLGVKSPWFLLPISLGELFHNYINYPEVLPKFLRKLYDWFLIDLFKSKSTFLAAIYQLPTVNRTILKIKQFSIEKSTLQINTKLSAVRQFPMTGFSKYLTNPLNTFEILRIADFSNSSLLKILLKYIPKKFATLVLVLLPLFLIKHLIQNLKKSDENTPNLSKREFLESFKSALKISASLVLTASSSFALFVLNEHFNKSPAKNLRIIGAVSSLWFLAFYKATNLNKILLTYLARITFLGTNRKLKKKYQDSTNIKYLNPFLSSVGLGLLVALAEKNESNKYISPQRITKYLKFLTTA